MEKRKLSLLIGCAASTFFLMPSCVNDDYDLNKDIDMTINVGGDLTIPTSATSEMKMKDLLDLEDDGIVKVKDPDANGDGVYYLMKGSDEPSSFSFKIDPIEVDALERKEFKMEFTIPTQMELLVKGGLSEREAQMVIDAGGNFDVIKELNPSFNPMNEYQSDPIKLDTAIQVLDYDFSVPDELVALNFIDFSNHPMKPEFSLRHTMEKGVVDLHDVYAEFPGILMHDEYHEGGNWTWEPTKDEGRHVFKFPLDVPLHKGDYYKVGLEFIHIDMTKKPWERGKDANGEWLKDQHIVIDEDVVMFGEVLVMATAEEFWDMAGHTYELIAYITMPAPEIETVTVRANPDIDAESTVIDLNDLPDFLTENEVSLVLKEPAIRLDVEGNVSAPVNCWGSLVSLGNENSVLNSVKIGDEDLLVGEDKRLVVGDGGNSHWCIYDGVKPTWEGYEYHKAEHLQEIVKVMPDSIKMNFDAGVDVNKYFKVELDKDYKATIQYQLECPLALDKGSVIVYSDTIAEWSEDLEDFEVGGVKMTARIDMGENMPFDKLDIDITPIDIEAAPIGKDLITVNELKNISNGQTIEILLSCKEGAMEILDGVVLKATAKVTTDNAQPLRSNSTIKLDNISVGIIGGVVVDMN